MKNYLQRGGTVTVTVPANVSSGDVVVVGALAGVAMAAADNGVTVVNVKLGVRGTSDRERSIAEENTLPGLAG